MYLVADLGIPLIIAGDCPSSMRISGPAVRLLHQVDEGALDGSNHTSVSTIHVLGNGHNL